MKEEAFITPKRIFLFAVFVYIILFFFYYPPFYTTLDEMGYIKGANHLKGGKVGIEDPMYRYGFIFNGRNYVPISYGMPIFLVPFTVFGWKSAFVSGLMVHILSALIFYKLLIEFGWNTDNVLLYLFFPYFFYYSTTLFPDFPSSFFILTGFYLYTSSNKRHNILSGAAFGIALLIKISNILAFIPFVLIPFIKDRIKFRIILLGFMPFMILILTLNHMYYGGIFKLGYLLLEPDPAFGTSFSPSFYRHYIPFIAFRLLLIYPLMLLAPLFYRGKSREEIILVVVIFFAFFGIRSQSGWGFNLDPSTFTRYFLPIMPLLLLTYIPFYETFVKRLNLPRNIILYGAVFVLISGGVFILSIQKERLGVQHSVSEEIYSNTVPHALLIGEFDVIRYLMEPFGDRRFLISGTKNISMYFDDKTYIIHKRFDKPSPIEEGPSKITEELIAEFNAKLIKKVRYTTKNRFFASRPFSLEIYKVL